MLAFQSLMFDFLYLLRQIRTIAIIAEGIPEAKTRQLNKKAQEAGVTIIGPATVSSLLSCILTRQWTVSRLTLKMGIKKVKGQISTLTR